jgi:hypothetical protein
MKKSLILLLFLITSFSRLFAQDRFIDSAKVCLQKFSISIEQLGIPKDSSIRNKEILSLLNQYQLSRKVPLPDLTLNDSLYRVKRQKLPFELLVKKLPYTFWQGFTFILDPSKAIIVQRSQSQHELSITFDVPVSLWGTQQDRLHTDRIGEHWLITIVAIKDKDLFKDIHLSKVEFTNCWIYDEPPTKLVIASVLAQLYTNIILVMDKSKDINLRKEALAFLQKKIKSDTIFFETTDKVLLPISINGCKDKENIPSILDKGIKIRNINLSYMTSFGRNINGLHLSKK